MQICLTRWRSLVFFGALFTAVVVGTSACQSTSAAVDADLARDLGLVDPSEVGISATRLERLDAGMQAMVDDGKLAGVTTMLARHGKVVFTDAAGKLDITKDAPVELDMDGDLDIPVQRCGPESIVFRLRAPSPVGKRGQADSAHAQVGAVL